MLTRKLDIRPQDFEVVQAILRRYVKDCPVWAFGSRVKGTAKPYSDLDLVIMSSQPLPLSTLAELADAFSESDLPFRVDVLDWSVLSEAFKQRIAADYFDIFGSPKLYQSNVWTGFTDASSAA